METKELIRRPDYLQVMSPVILTHESAQPVNDLRTLEQAFAIQGARLCRIAFSSDTLSAIRNTEQFKRYANIIGIEPDSAKVARVVFYDIEVDESLDESLPLGLFVLQAVDDGGAIVEGSMRSM